MKPRTVSAAGSEFERVQHRFDRWRKTRKRCTPIPDTLWSSSGGIGSRARPAPNRSNTPTELLLAEETIAFGPQRPGQAAEGSDVCRILRPEPQVIPPAPSRWKMHKVER